MIDLTDESIWTRIAAQQNRCVTRERNPHTDLPLGLVPAGGRDEPLHRASDEDGRGLRDTHRRQPGARCADPVLEGASSIRSR